MIRRQTKRAGFTLVEMLVATALTLFIMAIISTAFRAGLDTFSKLRTAGELQSKLRNTTKIMSRDLAMDHFGPMTPDISTSSFSPNFKIRGPKLSDQRLDLIGWSPPASGYFMLYQPGPSMPETIAADGESIGSTKFPDPATLGYPAAAVPYISPVLSFTMKLPTNEYSQQFTTFFHPTLVPTSPFEFTFNSGSMSSPWAQVHYSLVPTPGGDTTEPGPNGEPPMPLYSLRRQMWLLAPDINEARFFPVTNAQYAQLANFNQTWLGKVRVIEDTTSPAPAGYNNLRLLTATNVMDPSIRYSSLTTTPNLAPLGMAPVYYPPTATTPPFPYTPPTVIVRPPEDPNGDDILLTNVISFQIKAMWEQQQAPSMGLKQIMTPLRTLAGGNPDWPFDDLPQDQVMNGASSPFGVNQRWFDTWYPVTGPDWENAPISTGIAPDPIYAQPPLRIRIKALQIKLRIWDEKSKQSRQVTFIQEV